MSCHKDRLQNRLIRRDERSDAQSMSVLNCMDCNLQPDTILSTHLGLLGRRASCVGTQDRTPRKCHLKDCAKSSSQNSIINLRYRASNSTGAGRRDRVTSIYFHIRHSNSTGGFMRVLFLSGDRKRRATITVGIRINTDTDHMM
jgi:hypothetical protein